MPTPNRYEYITDDAVVALMLEELDDGNPDWTNDLGLRIDSNNDTENYAWLGSVPGLHEFIANRRYDELKEYSFSITNNDFESNILLWKKELRRDKLGMIQARVGQFGDRVRSFPAKLFSDLMINAESALCYDGQFYFDTDHPVGSTGSVQSNDITASATSATAPTTEEMIDAFIAGAQAIIGMKDDQGEPTNQSARRFIVHVPLTFMRSALAAVSALYTAGGASNILPGIKGKIDFDVQVNPRLNWTTKIAVFRADAKVKPFILQQDGEPEPVALGPDSEFCITTKKCLYGIDWSGNAGYGDYKSSALVTFS